MTDKNQPQVENDQEFNELLIAGFKETISQLLNKRQQEKVENLILGGAYGMLLGGIVMIGIYTLDKKITDQIKPVE